MRMNRENDGTEATAQVGLAHGGAGLSDVDRVLDGPAGPLGRTGGPAGGPHNPAGGLAGGRACGLTVGSTSILEHPGRPGNPRAAVVLRAVGEYLRRGKVARPGRAKRKRAPDSAPLFREPAFSASGAGCSSPYRTTQPIRGQDGADQRDKDAGRAEHAAAGRTGSGLAAEASDRHGGQGRAGQREAPLRQPPRGAGLARDEVTKKSR